MAYARRSTHCGWYIYWASNDLPSDRQSEQLFIQGPWRESSHGHVESEPVKVHFLVREVSEMLASGDFSPIPGFTEADRAVVGAALRDFIDDIERQYGAA